MNWERAAASERVRDWDSTYGDRAAERAAFQTNPDAPPVSIGRPPKAALTQAQVITHQAILGYTGPISFVRDLQALALGSDSWRPTQKQAAKVLEISQEEAGSAHS